MSRKDRNTTSQETGMGAGSVEELKVSLASDTLFFPLTLHLQILK